MTKKQKIVFGVVVLVIVILLSILFMFINQLQNESDGGGENGDSDSGGSISVNGDGEGASDSGGSISVNGDGEGASDSGDIATGIVIDADTHVPVSTEYNEKHNYTLIDYLPAGDYKFLSGEESNESYIEYYIIKENTAIDKGIVVSVDSCNEEKNKAAANEYLKSLPVDLSDYIIVYQVHVGDVPCNEQ